jgi:hypothetical protein
LKQMAQFSPAQAYAAETLGTAILLATVVGSGIMAENLAGGNVAIALLGNTIPTGAILVVLITILGPISGAQLNPAVSLAMSLTRRMPWARLLPFAACQINFWPARHDLRRASLQSPGHSSCGWPLHNGSVLVYRFDIVRQPGGDDCPGID